MTDSGSESWLFQELVLGQPHYNEFKEVAHQAWVYSRKGDEEMCITDGRYFLPAVFSRHLCTDAADRFTPLELEQYVPGKQITILSYLYSILELEDKTLQYQITVEHFKNRDILDKDFSPLDVADINQAPGVNKSMRRCLEAFLTDTELAALEASNNSLDVSLLFSATRKKEASQHNHSFDQLGDSNPKANSQNAKPEKSKVNDGPNNSIADVDGEPGKSKVHAETNHHHSADAGDDTKKSKVNAETNHTTDVANSKMGAESTGSTDVSAEPETDSTDVNGEPAKSDLNAEPRKTTNVFAEPKNSSEVIAEPGKSKNDTTEPRDPNVMVTEHPQEPAVGGDSISVSQLLEDLGRQSPEKGVPMEEELEERAGAESDDGKLTHFRKCGKDDLMTEALLAPLPLKDLTINAEQQAILDSIPEWKPNYQPPSSQDREEPSQDTDRSSLDLFAQSTCQSDSDGRNSPRAGAHPDPCHEAGDKDAPDVGDLPQGSVITDSGNLPPDGSQLGPNDCAKDSSEGSKESQAKLSSSLFSKSDIELSGAACQSSQVVTDIDRALQGPTETQVQDSQPPQGLEESPEDEVASHLQAPVTSTPLPQTQLGVQANVDSSFLDSADSPTAQETTEQSDGSLPTPSVKLESQSSETDSVSPLVLKKENVQDSQSPSRENTQNSQLSFLDSQSGDSLSSTKILNQYKAIDMCLKVCLTDIQKNMDHSGKRSALSLSGQKNIPKLPAQGRQIKKSSTHSSARSTRTQRKQEASTAASNPSTSISENSTRQTDSPSQVPQPPTSPLGKRLRRHESLGDSGTDSDESGVEQESLIKNCVVKINKWSPSSVLPHGGASPSNVVSQPDPVSPTRARRRAGPACKTLSFGAAAGPRQQDSLANFQLKDCFVSLSGLALSCSSVHVKTEPHSSPDSSPQPSPRMTRSRHEPIAGPSWREPEEPGADIRDCYVKLSNLSPSWRTVSIRQVFPKGPRAQDESRTTRQKRQLSGDQGEVGSKGSAKKRLYHPDTSSSDSDEHTPLTRGGKQKKMETGETWDSDRGSKRLRRQETRLRKADKGVDLPLSAKGKASTKLPRKKSRMNADDDIVLNLDKGLEVQETPLASNWSGSPLASGTDRVTRQSKEKSSPQRSKEPDTGRSIETTSHGRARPNSTSGSASNPSTNKPAHRKSNVSSAVDLTEHPVPRVDGLTRLVKPFSVRLERLDLNRAQRKHENTSEEASSITSNTTQATLVGTQLDECVELQPKKGDLETQQEDDLEAQQEKDDLETQQEKDDLETQQEKDDLETPQEKDDLETQQEKDLETQQEKDDLETQQEKDDLETQQERGEIETLHPDPDANCVETQSEYSDLSVKDEDQKDKSNSIPHSPSTDDPSPIQKTRFKLKKTTLTKKNNALGSNSYEEDSVQPDQDEQMASPASKESVKDMAEKPDSNSKAEDASFLEELDCSAFVSQGEGAFHEGMSLGFLPCLQSQDLLSPGDQNWPSSEGSSGDTLSSGTKNHKANPSSCQEGWNSLGFKPTEDEDSSARQDQCVGSLLKFVSNGEKSWCSPQEDSNELVQK